MRGRNTLEVSIDEEGVARVESCPRRFVLTDEEGTFYVILAVPTLEKLLTDSYSEGLGERPVGDPEDD